MFVQPLFPANPTFSFSFSPAIVILGSFLMKNDSRQATTLIYMRVFRNSLTGNEKWSNSDMRMGTAKIPEEPMHICSLFLMGRVTTSAQAFQIVHQFFAFRSLEK